MNNLQAQVTDGFTFTDADVVNKDDYIPAGEYNPHKVRPFLLHDQGRTVAVVFADCLQDAMDIAVDNDKLDRFLITDANKADYWDAEKDLGNLDGSKGDWNDSVTFLGNAGEPFDIESLGAVDLVNPPFSFVALYNHMAKLA